MVNRKKIKKKKHFNSKHKCFFLSERTSMKFINFTRIGNDASILIQCHVPFEIIFLTKEMAIIKEGEEMRRKRERKIHRHPRSNSI